MDFAHMDINAQEVQDKLGKPGPGMFIGSGEENQLWGFNRDRRGFFEDYYADALRVAYAGDNAWYLLLQKVEEEFEDKGGLDCDDYCLYIDNDGSQAEQPATSSTIPGERLAEIFSERGNRAIAGLPALQAKTAASIASRQVPRQLAAAGP